MAAGREEGREGDEWMDGMWDALQKLRLAGRQ